MTPGYRLTANAALRDRNTFGVPATAPWLVAVSYTHLTLPTICSV